MRNRERKTERQKKKERNINYIQKSINLMHVCPIEYAEYFLD